jgi:hypothetical protein
MGEAFMNLKKFWILAPIAALVVTGCSSSSVGNAISGAAGQKGYVRMIDASPNAPGPLSMLVANTAINSGVSASLPVGVYATIGAGEQTVQIQPTNVPSQRKSFAASTFYTTVLAGEPGAVDYNMYILQDTNSLPSSATVRFKVNDAAPAPGPIDVYVYQGAQPATPTVAGLTVGNDSGSTANPAGNAYIPTLGSATTLPSGTYTIAVTPAGKPTTILFSGSAHLSQGVSYSFTVTDVAGGSPNAAAVILSQDQPVENSNQSNLMELAHQP